MAHQCEIDDLNILLTLGKYLFGKEHSSSNLIARTSDFDQVTWDSNLGNII